MSAKDNTNIVNNFENMMRLAEYGANRHAERRQVLFRIFISYMTLLVVISGLIMNNWKDDFIESELFVWGVSALLFGMLITYCRWLRMFYKASDYDVRRRDFYLTKAQVICYYMSELSQCYSGCKEVYLNLGNDGSYKISERCLFKKRHPDIEPQTVVEGPCPPTVWGNRHFYFHLFAPAGLTILIVAALLIHKFLTDSNQP